MKTRILLLITNLDFGGAQRVFKNLSEGLAEKYEVIECVFNLHTNYAFPSGNQLINLDIPGGKNLVEKIFYFLKRSYKVNRLKKNYEIALTISHLEGADYVNFVSGGKSIACIHGSKIHDDNITGWIGWFRLRIAIPFVYKRMSHIVTVSKGIKGELVRHFKCKPENISVINNGLDINEIIKRASEELDDFFISFFSSHKVAIAHGRLVDEKNYDLLITIFSSNEINSKMKLVIIGDGIQRDHPLNKCRQLGLKAYHPWGECELNDSYNVYFLGYQSNPYRFLSKAYLYMLPSKYEGYPMSLCEALVCKLPVIAADCDYGPGDILRGPHVLEKTDKVEVAQYGILVKTYEPDVWIAAVTKMLSNENLTSAYRRKGDDRTKAFSLDTFKNAWTQVTNQNIV